jgi:hypothetical protein
VPIVLKSGSLNLLEPSGPVQACNGTVLPLPIALKYRWCNNRKLFERSDIVAATAVFLRQMYEIRHTDRPLINTWTKHRQTYSHTKVRCWKISDSQTACRLPTAEIVALCYARPAARILFHTASSFFTLN